MYRYIISQEIKYCINYKQKFDLSIVQLIKKEVESYSRIRRRKKYLDIELRIKIFDTVSRKNITCRSMTKAKTIRKFTASEVNSLLFNQMSH